MAASCKQCTAVLPTGERCPECADPANHAQRCPFHAVRCRALYEDYKSWLEGRHEENDVPVSACRSMRVNEREDQYKAYAVQKRRAALGAVSRVSDFDSTCLRSHADFDYMAEVGGRAGGHAARLAQLRSFARSCEEAYATAASQARFLREERLLRQRQAEIARAARERGIAVREMLVTGNDLDENASARYGEDDEAREVQLVASGAARHPRAARGEMLLPTRTPPREPAAGEYLGAYRIPTQRRARRQQVDSGPRALRFE